MLSPRKTDLCWRWFWGTGIGLLLLFFNLINDMCINKNGTSTKTPETRALNGSTEFWFIQIKCDQLVNYHIKMPPPPKKKPKQKKNKKTCHYSLKQIISNAIWLSAVNYGAKGNNCPQKKRQKSDKFCLLIRQKHNQLISSWKLLKIK